VVNKDEYINAVQQNAYNYVVKNDWDLTAFSAQKGYIVPSCGETLQAMSASLLCAGIHLAWPVSGHAQKRIGFSALVKKYSKSEQ